MQKLCTTLIDNYTFSIISHQLPMFYLYIFAFSGNQTKGEIIFLH